MKFLYGHNFRGYVRDAQAMQKILRANPINTENLKQNQPVQAR